MPPRTRTQRAVQRLVAVMTVQIPFFLAAVEKLKQYAHLPSVAHIKQELAEYLESILDALLLLHKERGKLPSWHQNPAYLRGVINMMQKVQLAVEGLELLLVQRLQRQKQKSKLPSICGGRSRVRDTAKAVAGGIFDYFKQDWWDKTLFKLAVTQGVQDYAFTQAKAYKAYDNHVQQQRQRQQLLLNSDSLRHRAELEFFDTFGVTPDEALLNLAKQPRVFRAMLKEYGIQTKGHKNLPNLLLQRVTEELIHDTFQQQNIMKALQKWEKKGQKKDMRALQAQWRNASNGWKSIEKNKEMQRKAINALARGLVLTQGPRLVASGLQQASQLLTKTRMAAYPPKDVHAFVTTASSLNKTARKRYEQDIRNVLSNSVQKISENFVPTLLLHAVSLGFSNSTSELSQLKVLGQVNGVNIADSLSQIAAMSSLQEATPLDVSDQQPKALKSFIHQLLWSGDTALAKEASRNEAVIRKIMQVQRKAYEDAGNLAKAFTLPEPIQKYDDEGERKRRIEAHRQRFPIEEPSEEYKEEIEDDENFNADDDSDIEQATSPVPEYDAPLPNPGTSAVPKYDSSLAIGSAPLRKPGTSAVPKYDASLAIGSAPLRKPGISAVPGYDASLAIGSAPLQKPEIPKENGTEDKNTKEETGWFSDSFDQESALNAIREVFQESVSAVNRVFSPLVPKREANESESNKVKDALSILQPLLKRNSIEALTYGQDKVGEAVSTLRSYLESMKEQKGGTTSRTVDDSLRFVTEKNKQGALAALSALNYVNDILSGIPKQGTGSRPNVIPRAQQAPKPTTFSEVLQQKPEGATIKDVLKILQGKGLERRDALRKARAIMHLHDADKNQALSRNEIAIPMQDQGGLLQSDVHEFHRIDTGKDTPNALTEHELRNYFSKLGSIIPVKDARKFLDKYGNGDGRVTLEEFQRSAGLKPSKGVM